MDGFPPIRLSVLDTSPIVQGSTARQALHNTLDLAVLAERLGYYRYWVPEHHSMRGVASSSPAVLVGQIVNNTESIRVGSGGVLLPNHPPLIVAEEFGTLAALHSNRIDLGIGRAPGGPQAAAKLLANNEERMPGQFSEQVRELIGYFEEPEKQDAKAIPAIGNEPQFWMLGSTSCSAELAGALGLPYAFAHHLNPDGLEAIQTYREAFQKSALCDRPRVLVSVSIIEADTDERAEWLAGSTRLKVLSRVRGQRILLPSPEEAGEYAYTEDDLAEIAGRSKSVLVGAPDTVRKDLHNLVEKAQTEEIMVTTPVYRHEDRRRSYELLMESMS